MIIKLLTLASSICFSLGAYAQLNFAPIHYYSTSLFGSGNFVVGDVNNDGKPDIAAPFLDVQKVGLLMNSGSGTFGAPAFYNVAIGGNSGVNPAAVALGDVNGDSFIDIIATHPTYSDPISKVSVLMNNGDGTFAAPVFYDTDYYPTAVLLQDFNGDGKLDVVTANSAGTTVSVLLNNGDGTFAPQVAYGAGLYPQAIASADFDGDGSYDLALTNSEGGLILTNNGSGIFSPGPSVPSLSIEYQRGNIIAPDMNGDNKPDLVVSTLGVEKKFSVFMNNGNGNFNPPISNPHSRGVLQMAASDVNNDGKTDIVIISNTWEPHNNIYLSDGTGTFTDPVKIPGMMGAQSIVVADLNGDGKPDLINGSSNTDSFSVVLQAETVGVRNFGTSSALGIKLFPNPGKTNVTVVALVKDILRIYDAAGRLLETIKIKEGANNINIQKWSAGMYLFEVGGKAVKFEKEK